METKPKLTHGGRRDGSGRPLIGWWSSLPFQDRGKLLKITKTKNLPRGQAAPFTIEGQKIALFNLEGTYYAIGDTCAHRGAPLLEGDVQGTRVTCPWHGADFDLKTGAALGPPAQKGVPSYKVVVEGDDIKVEV
jgi:3-phenylpropionate/trans-cinnamate dioxygenase ferredoxin subunit